MLIKLLMMIFLIAITLVCLYDNEKKIEEEAEIKELYKKALEENKKLLDESLERLV